MFKKLKKKLTETPEHVEAPGPRVAPDALEILPADGATAGKATYQVDDFASLSEGEIDALLERAASDRAHGLADCAHLVVTRDLATGAVSHHVPCSSAIEAFALATQVVADKQAAGPERAFSVLVIPLLPH